MFFAKLPARTHLAVLLAFVCTTARAQGAAMPDLASRAAQMHARTGDRVAVKVYGEPAMSDMVTVDERGRITLPRIGTLQANEMALGELRDTVRSRLAKFLNAPAVDVTVLRRIIVSGEVARPGVYYAELTTSLGEMVAQAGGLRESGNPSQVHVVRGATRTHVPDWSWDTSSRADLHSGDQILVGRKSWLALNVLPVVSVATSVVALIISLRR